MKRSKHSLSYTKLFSCDMGELVPAGLTEVLPGDSVQMNTSALVRVAPMLSPPMHPTEVCIHHWFVPNRILWDGWEEFITGGEMGDNNDTVPIANVTTVTQGSLANYLGLPIGNIPGHSALPYRAYQLIWNEWYRDQDLQTKAVVSKASGPEIAPAILTDRTLKNVCWEKDYFTTARPTEQKGPPQLIPLTGTANLAGTAVVQESGVNRILEVGGTGLNPPVQINRPAGGVIGQDLNINIAGTANLLNAGITVNALRQTLAIQRYQEAAMRYGGRYVEYLARLGVRSSDGRLSRPEYLGGGRQTLQFSEVLQTAQDAASPVGTLRGHGISALRSNSFTRFFEEHGFVMTLFYCKPKTIYTSGLPRSWFRRLKFDYWQPELQNIGQQPVYNKELRAASAAPDGIFGYQDRYDEYRRSESLVAGEFATSTLNFWHFSRDFATDPLLNSTFVTAVPTERPFAVPAQDSLYVNARHSIKARRILPATANPRTF